jgi:hypothetical protein
MLAISIPAGLTDDNDFVRCVNAIVATEVHLHSPDVVWLIHVNNWFDHKWLRFSGNGAIGSVLPPPFAESVKEPSWNDKLTFPPFSPERILEQWSFELTGSGYAEVPLPRLPHKDARSLTYLNLNRRVEGFGSSALYVWYSGNTLRNGRGSIMSYRIGAGDPVCWFAALRRHGAAWIVERTKGISREVLVSSMNG